MRTIFFFFLHLKRGEPIYYVGCTIENKKKKKKDYFFLIHPAVFDQMIYALTLWKVSGFQVLDFT